MKESFICTILFLSIFVYSQQKFETRYPSEKDSSGTILRTPVKEKFEGYIQHNDTIKNGAYTLFFQFQPGPKLEGLYKNGMKDGLFTSYFPTGKKKWERNYSLNHLSGEEKIFNQRGELLFKGEYTLNAKTNESAYRQTDANGLLTVNASYLRDTLNGEFTQWQNNKKLATFHFKSGIKHGVFEVYNADNGSIIEKGFYKSGKISDTLYNYYPNGTLKSKIYFEDDKPNGDFLTYYPNGQINQKCTYQHDTLEGIDSIFYENGQIATITNYKKGLRHNVYLSYFQNGQEKIIKHFENDKENGEVIEHDSLGHIIQRSHYTNGKVDGEVLLYYPNAILKARLRFSKDKKIGTHTYYYPNQHIKKEELYNSLGKLSASKEFYTSGKIKSETHFTYKEDNLLNKKVNQYATISIFDENGRLLESKEHIDKLPHGKSIKYFPNTDQIQEISPYNFGKIHGTLEHYSENGKLISKENYLNGKLNGPSEKFNKKGKKEEVINYRNNKKHGVYELYTEKGKLIQKGTYYNNLKNGKWQYFSKGKLISEETYKKGVLQD